MKTCSICKQSKSLDDFNKDKNKKDGLNSACRSCTKKKAKEYEKKNKGRKALYDKKYREQNKEKIAAYKKEYYKINKDKIKCKKAKYIKNKRRTNKFFNRAIKDRFRSTILPYNYEIVKVFEGEAQEMSKLEKKMQKDNKQNKYIPKIKFSGMHECFKTLTNI